MPCVPVDRRNVQRSRRQAAWPQNRRNRWRTRAACRQTDQIAESTSAEIRALPLRRKEKSHTTRLTYRPLTRPSHESSVAAAALHRTVRAQTRSFPTLPLVFSFLLRDSTSLQGSYARAKVS